jgi:1,2-diacylglycerol 3-alpha-glucosyltransferase
MSAPGKQPHVAVLFHRLGPYHHARLAATAAKLKVTAVEMSNVDSTYAWDLVSGADDFDRVTLFSTEAVEDVPTDRVVEQVGKTLKRIQPDAVTIPGWHDRCSLAALLWCVKEGVPVVIMSDSTAWDEKRRWWKEWVKSRVLGLCAAGLVAGSAHAAYLEQLGLDGRAIFLGYDVVDNNYFAKKADESRKKKPEYRNRYHLPENYFLASARFVEKKNLIGLLQAYAQYRQLAASGQNGAKNAAIWDLVLVGDGPIKSELCYQITNLGLQDSVLLPGFKQYEELPAYYGLAKAFILASTTDQWGLVVNEAMAAGLPVLVSNRCGCAASLVQNGVNGFTFDPCNISQLSQLMLKISADDFLLSELGDASREIIKNWSCEKFAESLAAACQNAPVERRKKTSYLNRSATYFLLHSSKRFSRAKTERFERAGGLASGNLPPVMVVPNFFIIGAPKSGTTAMSEYLRSHPHVFFSKVKEPHFFDRDNSTCLKIKLDTYLSLFSQADPGRQTAIGEGSSGYLFSKVAVAEILKFNPFAKLIVMLRNPVELVQSWHCEMYFEGVENIREFETAWNMEKQRRLGRNIPSSCWERQKLFYSEWGKLGDQMERLFSRVDRRQVKVILFDDFLHDPRLTYESVLAFLGVPLDGRTNFEPVNESRCLKQAWLQRRVACAMNYFRRFRAATGLHLNLGSGLSQRLFLLNSKPARRNPISPSFRAELENFYRDDVQKLSDLLGRDLSGWVQRTPSPSHSLSL